MAVDARITRNLLLALALSIALAVVSVAGVASAADIVARADSRGDAVRPIGSGAVVSVAVPPGFPGAGMAFTVDSGHRSGCDRDAAAGLGSGLRPVGAPVPAVFAAPLRI